MDPKQSDNPSDPFPTFDSSLEGDAGKTVQLPDNADVLVTQGNSSQVDAGDAARTVQLDSAASADDIDTGATVQLSENIVDSRTVMSDIIDGSIPLSPEDMTRCTVDIRSLAAEDRADWSRLADQSAMKTVDSSVMAPPIESLAAMESNLLLVSRKLEERDNTGARPGLTPDYEIVKMLGKGGMGAVYAARQASLDRTVAVKVIQPLSEEQLAKLTSTGRLAAAEKQRREQFLSEAVVTGDLDHPNIVPIHDVARTHDGNLFYSMKRVEGTPWEKVIATRSLEENLEILLKVCDAVGFAHSRGVIHRDIKPENVMLGEFGAVMLMDWGLALTTATFQKKGSVRAVSSLGGSPAYMAPELALGPVDRISPAADIYLLGAVLFQMVTGVPPHYGKNLAGCLRAAAANKIVDAPPEKRGQLLDIALKAMETSPRDRHQTVQELQSAIRNYRLHLESVRLAGRAQEDLNQAEASQVYADYARAVFGFEEALKLWAGNDSARDGLAVSRLAYAEAAHRKEDFDLGLSLLDEQQPIFTATAQRLRQGLNERNSRRRRLEVLRRVAAVLAIVIVVGGGSLSFGLWQTHSQLVAKTGDLTVVSANLTKAEEQRGVLNQQLAGLDEKLDSARAAVAGAEVAKQEAERSAQRAQVEAGAAIAMAQQNAQQLIAKAEQDGRAQLAMAEQKAAEDLRKVETKAAAEVQRYEALTKTAEQALTSANTNLKAVEANLVTARDSQQRAEANSRYELYLAQISLARTRLQQNQQDEARRVLEEIRRTQPASEPLGWEWNRLWFEANRPQGGIAAPAGADGRDVWLGPTGRRAVSVLENGQLQLTPIVDARLQTPAAVALAGKCTAAVLNATDDLLAAGLESGEIQLFSTSNGTPARTLRGHTGEITALRFVGQQGLMSASRDGSIKLWDVTSGASVAAGWHFGEVRDLDAAVTPQGILAAAAVGSDGNGRVCVWRLVTKGREQTFEQQGDFLEHKTAPDAVAVAPDGSLIASGDREGRILLWQPGQSARVDYNAALTQAIRELRTGEERTLPASTAPIRAASLRDDALAGSELRLTAIDEPIRAHEEAVQRLRFSADGRRLISASSDFTSKVWDVSSGGLLKTLKGHGGRVRGATFSAANPDLVLTAGKGGVLAWSAAAPEDAVTFVPTSEDGAAQVHRDEIWCAAFDRTGTRIVTGSRDHTSRIVEIDPKTLQFKSLHQLRDDDTPRGAAPGLLNEGTGFVSLSLAVDEPHQRLFMGGVDGSIRVWSLDRAVELAQLPGTGLNSSFALSRDGRFLLTGSSSAVAGECLIWTIDDEGRPLSSPRKLTGHQEAVTAFAIAPDGKLFCTGDRKGKVCLWNSAGEQQGTALTAFGGARINAASFDETGQELFLALDSGAIARVKVSTGQVIEALTQPEMTFAIDLAVTGEQLLAIYQAADKNRDELRTQLVRWQLGRGSEKSQSVLAEEQRAPRQASLAMNAAPLLRSIRLGSGAQAGLFTVALTDVSGRNGQVKVYRATPEKPPVLLQSVALPRSIAPAEVAVPVGEGQVLTLNGDSAFRWNLRTLAHDLSYRPHSGITEVGFSPDSRFVISGSRSIKIWDVSTHRSVCKVEYPHEGAVLTTQFSPVSDSVFVSAGSDGLVKLWNWTPGASEVRPGPVHVAGKRAIRDARFSADGKHVLVVGDGGYAALWTPESGHVLTLPVGESAPNLLAGALSADGHWVLVGGADRLARLWKLSDDLTSAEAFPPCEGHADQIDAVAFLEPSPGNTAELRLLTGSRDKSLRIWDPRLNAPRAAGSAAAPPREIMALRRHSQGITAVDTFDHGRLVLSAGLDGKVILWPTGVER